MRQIKIPSIVPNQFLDATLFFPEKLQKKNPAILFLHGWRSSQDGYLPRAQALTSLGYVCLSFSLRGHGKSDGNITKFTRQDFFNDALSAYDFLVKQACVDPKKIGVVGASFGAYLGALLSKKRSINWLVLRVPANYPDEGFADMSHVLSTHENPEIASWRERKLSYTETTALGAIHNYKGKILLIESENDVIIPHQAVQNYKDAVSDPSQLTYILMQNADHAILDPKYKQEFIQILVDWFAKRITQSSLCC